MRKLIIDTDTGSDDAVALLMALNSKDIDILAITTVAGNVNLEKATRNALMTVEISNNPSVQVYKGASKPLMRDLITAENVHGEDGMGDQGLINPSKEAMDLHAVDKIIELIKAYPGQVDIVTIGPLTNIALAIMKAPEVMKETRHIYTMSTPGFGRGNATPVSEFNVYVDAESYHVLLTSGIPTTIIGFDLCLGHAAWNKDDMDALLSSNIYQAEYAVKCNDTLLRYNLNALGKHIVDLPDAVAMAVALWDDVILDSKDCHCVTCTNQHDPTYAQVIINDGGRLAVTDGLGGYEANARVIAKFDHQLYKDRLFDLLTK